MFVVASGKSLLCKKGILEAGKEIKENYISGSKEDFEKLISAGLIVKSNESIAEVVKEEKKEEPKESLFDKKVSK